MLMLMAMMNIGKVGMRVPQRGVMMGMSMRLMPVPREIMTMPMMFIMNVMMIMYSCIMNVLVMMPF